MSFTQTFTLVENNNLVIFLKKSIFIIFVLVIKR